MSKFNSLPLVLLIRHALSAFILVVMLSMSAANKPTEHLARASTDLIDPFLTYLPMLTKYVLDPLDSTFGEGGIILADIAENENPGGLAIQPDGKLILAGNASFLSEGDDLILLRFNPDGSLDPSFDEDGILVTDLGGYDYAKALVIQADGKIVVAGYSIPLGELYSSAVLVRYNPNGSLDTSFGDAGVVVTDAGKDDIFLACALQSDGRIVAAGRVADYDLGVEDIFLARYNQNGSPDPSFSSDGMLVEDHGSAEWIEALAVQSDGKLVATGVAAQDLAVLRYLSNGSPDASFSEDGLATVDVEDAWNIGLEVVIQADQKILVSGVTDHWTDSDFLLARFSTAGSLDPAFSSDGVVTPDLGEWEFGTSLAIDKDGRIILGGTTDGDFALLAYHPDGSPDTSFGKQGLLTIDFFGGYDSGEALALQADGKIVMTGSASDLDEVFFALARIK